MLAEYVAMIPLFITTVVMGSPESQRLAFVSKGNGMNALPGNGFNQVVGGKARGPPYTFLLQYTGDCMSNIHEAFRFVIGVFI